VWNNQKDKILLVVLNKKTAFPQFSSASHDEDDEDD